MRYFTKWCADDTSKPFDHYVIVHSRAIGEKEVAEAETRLRANKNILTDDAMCFIVFLDPDLDTSEVRSELKAESFRRLETNASQSS